MNKYPIKAEWCRVVIPTFLSLSKEEEDLLVKKIVEDIKKVPLIDEKTGDYNLKYNKLDMTEDIYIRTPKDSKEFATHQIDIPDLTEEEKETFLQRFFGKYFKKKD